MKSMTVFSFINNQKLSGWMSSSARRFHDFSLTSVTAAARKTLDEVGRQTRWIILALSYHWCSWTSLTGPLVAAPSHHFNHFDSVSFSVFWHVASLRQCAAPSCCRPGLQSLRQTRWLAVWERVDSSRLHRLQWQGESTGPRPSDLNSGHFGR